MKPDDILKLTIAIGVLLLVAGCVAAVAFHTIPTGQLNLFTTLAVAVAASLGTVVGFLFGSSLGSRDKDKALINQAQP